MILLDQKHPTMLPLGVASGVTWRRVNTSFHTKSPWLFGDL